MTSSDVDFLFFSTRHLSWTENQMLAPCYCLVCTVDKFSFNDVLSYDCVAMQFAVSTATIVSGAVAERVKFIAYGL